MAISSDLRFRSRMKSSTSFDISPYFSGNRGRFSACPSSSRTGALDTATNFPPRSASRIRAEPPVRERNAAAQTLLSTTARISQLTHLGDRCRGVRFNLLVRDVRRDAAADPGQQLFKLLSP